jgi:Holliday junction resolvasome RuvABC endonuclease subunit
MSIKSLVSSVKSNRIISIDPASHSLAWVVYDFDTSGLQMVACGKIAYREYKGASAKFNIIDIALKKLHEQYKPKIAVIEQSIYVQNFETSRIISYIIGYSWGVLNNLGCHVTDVNPLVWKSGIGYKNVGKKDKEILSNNGEKGSDQLKLKKERKRRVQEIVQKYFQNHKEFLDDDDIIDAAGIGLWYYTKTIKELNGA